VNRTGRRSFDKLARDPRVVEIWAEDRDGYWVQLQPGWNHDGASCVHGLTVAEVHQQMAQVEAGPTY